MSVRAVRRCLLVLVFPSMLFMQSVYCAALEKSLPLDLKRLLLNEQYQPLIKKLLPLARNGHAAAQYQLGLSYNSGLGVTVDKVAALQWFELASSQQHVKAMFNAAVILAEQGRQQQAITYFRMAANNGHKMATRRLQQINSSPSSVQSITEINQRLFYAARHGVLASVRECLQLGANPNQKNRDGQTALQLAVENRYPELVSYLIEAGASIEIPDRLGNTVLHYAVRTTDSDILEKVLHKNIIEQRNNQGDSALSLAVVLGQGEMVSLLLKAGANARGSNRDGRTLVDVALAKQRKPIVALLQKYGARPGAGDEDRPENRLQALELQLQQPAYQGWDALMLAAWSGDMDMVAWLLATNERAWQTGEALQLSLQQQHGEVAALLSRLIVERQAEVRQWPEYMRRAISVDALPSFEVFARAGNSSEVNAMLWQAVSSRAEAISGYLIARGANVNATGSDGSSCLQQAAGDGELLLIKALLAGGASINLQNDFGRTALWYAVNSGQLKAIQLLVAAGADVNLADVQGHAPLMRAIIKDQFQVAELLIEFGASTTQTTANGNTALITAAEKAGVDMIRLLLNHPGDIAQRNTNSLTALMIAVQRGNIDISRMLLEAGADPSRRNRNGKKPIAMTSNRAIKALLQQYD